MSIAASIAHEINSALGTDIRLGSDPYFRIERIPTGSLVMDRVLGGGFALGRHYELFGDESACKSYITYRTMAASQQAGNFCALIDPEHSFDPAWFEFLGGDPDSLILSQPDKAEDAVAAMMVLAKKAGEGLPLQVVGIDSVASLVPREEMEKDPREEDRIGGQARMMSRALRRITTVNKKTLFIWTNQERTNIGIRFGNPKTTSGGRALRYYATGRIEMRRGTKVTAKKKVAAGTKLVDREVTIGRWIQVRGEKEKSTNPYREGTFIFNARMNSIDIASEIVTLGLEDGLIERTASGWFSYTDLEDKEWKLTEKRFMKMLRENEDVQQELVSVIADNTIRQEQATDEEDGGEDG